MLVHIVSFIGSAFEITGVLLMANGFYSVGEEGLDKFRRILHSLISAFYRGNEGKNLVHSAEVASEERKLTTLQGLSFIITGFLIQAINSLYQVFFTA